MAHKNRILDSFRNKYFPPTKIVFVFLRLIHILYIDIHPLKIEYKLVIRNKLLLLSEDNIANYRFFLLKNISF